MTAPRTPPPPRDEAPRAHKPGEPDRPTDADPSEGPLESLGRAVSETVLGSEAVDDGATPKPRDDAAEPARASKGR